MIPKITFKEKSGRLLLKIAVHGKGHGIYETGITIDPTRFNEEQQICGDPEIQKWMTSTSNQLLTSFRPDMTAKRLWMSFLNNQSETSATIKDAFEYYLANMPLRDNSKAVYLSIGRTLAKAGLYKEHLTDVTPSMLRLFMNSLKTSPGSKFNTFVRIKATITRYLKDHRINLAIDFDGIVTKPRHTMKENQWLTLMEVHALLALDLKWALADARDLFCLSCVTGMALADVLQFSKKNIQVINGREFIVYDRVKTGSNCKIPIIEDAKKIIDSREWPVKIKERTFQYNTTKLGKMIGRELHPQLARKTMGALFLEFGFSIEAVSKMLGHSSIMMSQKHYTTISQKKIENEINNVSSLGLVAFSLENDSNWNFR